MQKGCYDWPGRVVLTSSLTRWTIILTQFYCAVSFHHVYQIIIRIIILFISVQFQNLEVDVKSVEKTVAVTRQGGGGLLCSQVKTVDSGVEENSSVTSLR